MKIAIVQFPGSNCERETKLAIQRAEMHPVEFLWNQPASLLNDMDGFVIVGGFSYEDRSRAGIVAALDPVMVEIKRQSEIGKPVLGICNGAQILVETGLVPGLKHHQIGMSLTENKRMANDKVLGTGFYNTWVHMRTIPHVRANAFTRLINADEVLTVPIAHAEGRFVMPDELLEEMDREGLTVFKYCDEQGQIIDSFPVNPNGSQHNLAAVINKTGNVMAMMPHPERTGMGDVIFQSMRDYIREGKYNQASPLAYVPPNLNLQPFQLGSHSHEMIIKLVITDNQALTVQNTLRQMGYDIQVHRMVHWEINTTDLDALEKIKQSGVLFNDRKEYDIAPESLKKDGHIACLVRSKDDLLGQQKRQMLQDQFLIHHVEAIHHGILWQFSSTEMDLKEMMDAIHRSHIIANPYAHVCYDYC